jgi:nicotinamidase/pyrazinamidase
VFVKTIFFDVDTQIDFLFPAGALGVPGAGSIAGNLSALTRFAAVNGIQILSTADAHSEDDPEFKIWKPHCVVETIGQRKVSATLAAKPVVLTTDPGGLDAIADQIAGARQIIIEKQNIDCFTRIVMLCTAWLAKFVYNPRRSDCFRQAPELNS